MTDARFLSNNSVTSEANHLKCKTLMQGSWAYKTPNNCRNRSKGSPLQGDSLPKSGNFPLFWGPRSHHRAQIAAKFCMAKRTHVPLGCAKFHVNWCNVSPLCGENSDFWPVSKFNTGSLPLCGNPVKAKIYNDCITLYAADNTIKIGLKTRLATANRSHVRIHGLPCKNFPRV